MHRAPHIWHLWIGEGMGDGCARTEEMAAADRTAAAVAAVNAAGYMHLWLLLRRMVNRYPRLSPRFPATCMEPIEVVAATNWDEKSRRWSFEGSQYLA